MSLFRRGEYLDGMNIVNVTESRALLMYLCALPLDLHALIRELLEILFACIYIYIHIELRLIGNANIIELFDLLGNL